MKAKNIILELFTATLALIVSVPLYLVAINTFKSNKDIVLRPLAPPTFSVSFDNMIRAFHQMDAVKAYATTLSIEFIFLAVGIFLCSLAGYAVARIKHKLFDSLYWVFMISILIPFQAGIIPLVFVLKDFGLNNTLLGISLVYIAVSAPFAIFVYSGFMRTIAKEMEESAYIDGCNPYRTFLQIIFPLIKPVTATLVILQFIYVWNDLLLPLVLLNTTDFPTVSIALYKFFNSRGTSDLSLLFGGISLVLIPILVLFFSFQKYFVKGLSTGSVKG